MIGAASMLRRRIQSSERQSPTSMSRETKENLPKARLPRGLADRTPAEIKAADRIMGSTREAVPLSLRPLSPRHR